MRVFLECKPDETLVLAVGVLRKNVVHSGGKGRVSRALRENQNVTGLVDEDPGRVDPPTLSQYVEVTSAHDVKLKIDAKLNNRLIVICPRLEPWLIKTSKMANVKMDDKRFNLSENLQELDSDINHRLPNLERLLNELLQLKSPRMLRLKELLSG